MRNSPPIQAKRDRVPAAAAGASEFMPPSTDPSAPTGLTATDDAAGGYVATWVAPVDGHPPGGYDVWDNGAGVGGWQHRGNVAGPTVTLNPTVNNGDFIVQVLAKWPTHTKASNTDTVTVTGGAAQAAYTLNASQIDALMQPAGQNNTKAEILAWLDLFEPLGFEGGSHSLSKGDLLDLVETVLQALDDYYP